MFDLRYHVTSLAAVFIALLIGILVGVALASHGLGNSERKSLEDDIRRAQSQNDQLRNLGRQLGREFVAGDETPLWNALHDLIVQEATPRYGASKRAADGVIVVRTADPQTGESAPFVKGLYEGIADAGEPAVGVAESTSDFPARPVFQQAQLSTVDDIDLPAGKLALVIVLSEPASRADYGINANDLLPLVTPVLAPSG